MKPMMYALLAVTALAASSGCCCLERWWCRPWGCNSNWAGGGGCGDSCGGCGDGGCGGGCSSCGGGGGPGSYAARGPRNSGGQPAFDDGPPGGQVAYPYYTNRGPRDFLARDPRSIGP
jgi:hypothetical protein